MSHPNKEPIDPQGRKILESKIPVLALKNTVLFPGLSQALRVGREISLRALKASEKHFDFHIIAVQQRPHPHSASNAASDDSDASGTSGTSGASGLSGTSSSASSTTPGRSPGSNPDPQAKNQEFKVQESNFEVESGAHSGSESSSPPGGGMDRFFPSPGPDDLYSIGTLCRIESIKSTAQEALGSSPLGGSSSASSSSISNSSSSLQVGSSNLTIVLRGISRVKLEQINFRPGTQDVYIEAFPLPYPDVVDLNAKTQETLMAGLKETLRSILRTVPTGLESLTDIIQQEKDLGTLTHLIGTHIDFPQVEKQKLLEMHQLRERGLHLLNLLLDFKENLTVQSEVRSKLNQKLGKMQRNTILREHLKTIQEELGENGDLTSEGKIQKQIEEAQMPEAVQKVAEQELRRLREIGTQSPESHIIRNYLDLLVSLPWKKSVPEKEIDLSEARRILDEDHYGLEKVKKRILQQLAVYKLKRDMKGSILLFLGPPGVGKTSLGQSIAKVLGRKFFRISLGGVRDDAEIRGHRRTYVGAMPGRFIQGFKRVGENNPLILLDEVDKLSRSWSGDPASALLEALDSEQNHNFMDHYLDVGFDLSKTIFIATANTLETIPPPLLDRMEVIELSSYTQGEKIKIAQNYLLPRQIKEMGIREGQVLMGENTLSEIVTSYTREAGVRDLQRKIAEILRGVSEKILEQQAHSDFPPPLIIEPKDLEPLLGQPKYFSERVEDLPPFGVATGLAWSPVGGDILFIEAQLMPGKGELILTGQLGEVMKESAQISLSLARHSKVAELFDFSKSDIHIHVPSGATPKDGPSAGIAIFVALVSLISQRPIKSDWAMTGEVTLRGVIMPVGGVKEKVIAAHRSGIKNIILPDRNRKDLEEIPQEVRDRLHFFFIQHSSEIFNLAIFASPLKPQPVDSKHL